MSNTNRIQLSGWQARRFLVVTSDQGREQVVPDPNVLREAQEAAKGTVWANYADEARSADLTLAFNVVHDLLHDDEAPSDQQDGQVTVREDGAFLRYLRDRAQDLASRAAVAQGELYLTAQRASEAEWFEQFKSRKSEYCRKLAGAAATLELAINNMRAKDAKCNLSEYQEAYVGRFLKNQARNIEWDHIREIGLEGPAGEPTDRAALKVL